MITEKRHTNFYKMASKYGLIMGLATSAVSFIEYLLEGKVNNLFVFYVLIFIAVIAVIVKGTLNYRKSLNGYISYWHAFLFGVMIFLFAGIVGAVYSYAINSIDPEYAYRQIETSRQYFISSGLAEAKVNELMAEMTENLSYQMQHPILTVAASAFGNMLLGALFCLISSAFLRKNKPETINES